MDSSDVQYKVERIAEKYVQYKVAKKPNILYHKLFYSKQGIKITVVNNHKGEASKRCYLKEIAENLGEKMTLILLWNI